MENFTFYSPTLFAFGKERENETGGLIKRFGASHQLSQADYDMIVMPINRLAEKPSGILKAARDKYVQKNLCP